MQASQRHPPKRFGLGDTGGNGRWLLLLVVLAPGLWLLSMFPAKRHFLDTAPERQPVALLAPPPAGPVLPDAAAAEYIQEPQSRAQQECWEQPSGSICAGLRTVGKNFFDNRARTSRSAPDRHGVILSIRAGPAILA